MALVLDAGQEDARAACLSGEAFDSGANRTLEEIVGERDRGAVVADKASGNAQSLGDPALLLLIPVQQSVARRIRCRRPADGRTHLRGRHR